VAKWVASLDFVQPSIHTLYAQPAACYNPFADFSFPFFSTTPSLFLSIFPGKLRGNHQILGSEPSLRLVWAQNQPNFRPTISKMPGILQRTRVYLEITLRPPGYFVDFLNFASDFAPDQLSWTTDAAGSNTSRTRDRRSSYNLRTRTVIRLVDSSVCGTFLEEHI